MRKYYIGLAIIGLFTLGVTIFTVAQGLASRQDNVTRERERDIANKLNAYVIRERKIPNSLDEAAIKDVPSTIKYEKNSDSEYKFCVTYKEASSFNYFSNGLTPLVTGRAVSQFAEGSSSLPTDRDANIYASSTLHMPYYHKKGETCQTIKPNLFNSSTNRYPNNNNYPNTYRPTRPTVSGTIATRDAERRMDINAIHGQLEAYFTNNGSYPTLANLNNASFRTANLKGLDTEALRDPSSTSTFGYVFTSPIKGYYSYNVTDNSGVRCTSTNSVKCSRYTLTATLEAGGTYVKQSLN